MLISDFHTTLVPLLSCVPKQQIFVFVDANTAEHCLPVVVEECPVLQSAQVLVLPAGEENKSLHTAELAWSFLFEHHATRQAVVINIGGGMVTDLGGFVASTYMRGIRCINIPTTLLAMVDASSGGKTGLNCCGIKNGVGTFSQPMETLIYPAFLSTLSSQDLLSGLAEMIKHGLIRSEKHLRDLMALLPDLDLQYSSVIEDSIAIKKAIVDADFKENNIRRALNFGHTIGHAIEEAYAAEANAIAHGYCVMWGMVAELYLSVIKLGCPRSVLTDMSHLMIEYYGRPMCNCRQREQLITWMLHDKKNFVASNGSDSQPQISFTLLRDIGCPIVAQVVSKEELNEALEYLFSL